MSGIRLLRRFIEIGESGADARFGEREQFWLVVIHIAFVVSGVLLALMDWLAVRSVKG